MNMELREQQPIPFVVGPKGSERSFTPGTTEVTYKTAKQEKEGADGKEYIVIGKSEDAKPGLILKEKNSAKQFAVSESALSRVEGGSDVEAEPTIEADPGPPDSLVATVALAEILDGANTFTEEVVHAGNTMPPENRLAEELEGLADEARKAGEVAKTAIESLTSGEEWEKQGLEADAKGSEVLRKELSELVNQLDNTDSLSYTELRALHSRLGGYQETGDVEKNIFVELSDESNVATNTIDTWKQQVGTEVEKYATSKGFESTHKLEQTNFEYIKEQGFANARNFYTAYAEWKQNPEASDHDFSSAPDTVADIDAIYTSEQYNPPFTGAPDTVQTAYVIKEANGKAEALVAKKLLTQKAEHMFPGDADSQAEYISHTEKNSDTSHVKETLLQDMKTQMERSKHDLVQKATGEIQDEQTANDLLKEIPDDMLIEMYASAPASDSSTSLFSYPEAKNRIAAQKDKAKTLIRQMSSSIDGNPLMKIYEEQIGKPNRDALNAARESRDTNRSRKEHERVARATKENIAFLSTLRTIKQLASKNNHGQVPKEFNFLDGNPDNALSNNSLANSKETIRKFADALRTSDLSRLLKALQ